MLRPLHDAVALNVVRSVDSPAEIPDLTDHYVDALAALVDAKLHAREPARRVQLVDLMGALQQSVRDARAARGQPDGS
ncbi:hypothetical protein [Streptomyces shenzhenensis]|uniref:Uncharacterized protein n=1 Tax=Streptomyces shenzhenensis TaxID=943815 RepID=A0A3M0HSE9_9ACTN|nr:hypothetical protein [Streptomyces shenzhenensis]RMB80381.1 hypothetical protein CTZ28_40435 [Streptomyces shenzhenensis]